ncbi:MAG: CapA family protein [Mammaliicoccus vitulinus]
MKNKIKMISYGDFLLENIFLESEDYKQFINIFNSKDIVTFNLETVVTNQDGIAAAKAFNFKVSEDNINILKNDIDSNLICNIANNHIMDYGYDSFEDTLKNLGKYNIDYVGYSNNTSIHEGILIKNIKGFKLAFIGAHNNYNANENKPGLTAIDDSLYEKVRHAKESSDFVILHLHWGEELSLSQSPKQIRIAHKLVDSGADIILGHHPHVIQEVERYKNAVIAYSLGNFQMMTYEYNYSSKYGIMLDLNLSQDKIDYEVIPVFIHDRIPRIVRFDSSLYQAYKEIKEYNNYFSKKNNWFLYYFHVSKPFYIDSLKAWQRRKKRKEKNLVIKKIKWFVSKKTIIMTLFVILNMLFERFQKINK